MNIKLDYTLVSYTLQEYIDDYNLTQKKLAESTGISASCLNGLLKGK